MATNLLIGFPDVQKNANAITSTGTFANLTPIHNSRGGPRYQIAQLSSASTEILRTDYDLGSATTKSSNFFILARADLLQASGATRVVLRGSTQSVFTPSSISGLTLWLDATRSVTASSGAVSQWSDLSGNGYHFTQSTAANKPILTRADNRENLLPYSEDFTTAETKIRLTVTANAAANPITGSTTADLITEDTSTNTHEFYPATYGQFFVGRTYTYSVYAKANGREEFRYYFNAPAFTGPSDGAVFNLTNVTAVAQGTATGAAITSVGGGWYKCEVSMLCGASGVSQGETFLHGPAGAQSYTGDGASGMYFACRQMRDSTADSTHVETTGYSQYRGTNGNRAVTFDGTDDSLTSTATTGNIMTNSAFTFFMALNFTTNDGGPSDQYYLQGGTGTASFVIYESSGNITFGVNDGAFRTVSKAATEGNVYIYKCRHEGGNIYGSLNNGSESSAACGNVATLSETLRMSAGGATTTIAGPILEIVAYNTNIGTTAETNVYEYLRDKWQTTGSVVENSFSTATLYGPRSDDYVSSFTASTAYRHWWLDFDATGASTKFPHSKAYWGTWFDFGDDPNSVKVERATNRSALFFTGSGACHLGRNDQPRYRFSIEWLGITDAKVESFLNYVVKDVHAKQGVFLYTSTYHEILDSQRLIHCTLVDVETEQIKGKGDYNRVTCIFEEMIG